MDHPHLNGEQTAGAPDQPEPPLPGEHPPAEAPHGSDASPETAANSGPADPPHENQPEPPPDGAVKVALNRQVQVVPGFANIAYYTRVTPVAEDGSGGSQFVGSIEIRMVDIQAAPAMLTDFAAYMEAQVKAFMAAAQEMAKRAAGQPGPEGARILAAATDAKMRGFKGHPPGEFPRRRR